MNSGKSLSLQKAISENQLTLRSVILASQARKKELTIKQVEFWIVFSVLITTIGACGALFFFEKIDIALMVASGVLVITIIFLLVMMIANFIKKN
jgi:FtsH-binding integral membrane protein